MQQQAAALSTNDYRMDTILAESEEMIYYITVVKRLRCFHQLQQTTTFIPSLGDFRYAERSMRNTYTNANLIRCLSKYW